MRGVPLGLTLLLACSEYELKENNGGSGGSDDGWGADSGDGREPDIAVDAELSLLSTCMATATDEVTIDSVGTAPLTVDAVSVDWDDRGTVTVTPAAALPVTLAPGESMAVTVAWEPGEAESMGGVLRVRSDDPDTPSASVDLSGAITVGGAPLVSLSVPDCYTVLLGDDIELVATITDEDAAADLAVTWESDVDGALQTGAADSDLTSTLAAALSEGTHTVTVTVTDACGQSASATIEITVVEARGTYDGPSPDGLDFDGDGYLWVADWASDYVYQLDPADLGILRRIALPYSGADGLSWMDDTMLVSFYDSNRVVAIDTCDGSELSSWRAPGRGVSDVSWDGTNLWLTDYDSARIFRVDPSTGSALDSQAAPMESPNGITFDGTDFWMTANGTTPRIVRTDTAFSIQESYDFRGDDPRGIAWDGTDIWYSDGSLWLIARLSR